MLPPLFFFFFEVVYLKKSRCSKKKKKKGGGGGNILKKKKKKRGSNIGSCPQVPVLLVTKVIQVNNPLTWMDDLRWICCRSYASVLPIYFVRCCIYLTTYDWIKSFLKITIERRAIYGNLENKINTLYLARRKFHS